MCVFGMIVFGGHLQHSSDCLRSANGLRLADGGAATRHRDRLDKGDEASGKEKEHDEKCIAVRRCENLAYAGNCFSKLLALRNHGRSRRFKYPGSVGFLARIRWVHSRASAVRP